MLLSTRLCLLFHYNPGPLVPRPPSAPPSSPPPPTTAAASHATLRRVRRHYAKVTNLPAKGRRAINKEKKMGKRVAGGAPGGTRNGL